MARWAAHRRQRVAATCHSQQHVRQSQTRGAALGPRASPRLQQENNYMKKWIFNCNRAGGGTQEPAPAAPVLARALQHVHCAKICSTQFLLKYHAALMRRQRRVNAPSSKDDKPPAFLRQRSPRPRNRGSGSIPIRKRAPVICRGQRSPAWEGWGGFAGECRTLESESTPA